MVKREETHIIFLKEFRNNWDDTMLAIWRNNMNRNEVYELLNILGKREYVTAKTMAEISDISVKTIRNRILEISEILESQAIGQIESRPHYGYMLIVHDQRKYQEFLESLLDLKQDVPNDPKERVYAVLSILLYQKHGVLIESIANKLYISRSSISNTLKDAEEILHTYHLSLQRKSHRGMVIDGEEKDKRKLIDVLVEKGSFYYEKDNRITLKMVQEKLTRIIQRNSSIVIYSAAFHKLTISIYVFAQRILANFYINEIYDAEAMNHLDDNILVITDQMVKSLEKLGIRLPKEAYTAEFFYLAILFQSQQTMIYKHQCSGTMIIPVHIQQKVNIMLKEVYNEFGIDLRNNLELRMLLYTHLIPFDIRMKYDIPVSNPQKDEIKEKYPLSFAVASYAYATIQHQYAKPISEDEIAYITPFIELFTDVKECSENKKSILIICSAGRASSQLLAFTIMKEFKSLISKIELKDMYSFTQEDLESFDFIFSTIPIQYPGIQIYCINPYLTKSDLHRVKDILTKTDNDSSFVEFYKENLFFTNVEGKTRNEVVHNICQLIARNYDKPLGNLEEKIIERESIYPTDYGNLIAFPHPMEACTEDTFIAVSVLKEPIKWNKKKVQLVFVISFGMNYIENEKIKNLNTCTFRLFSNKEAIQAILANPTYAELIDQLQC